MILTYKYRLKGKRVGRRLSAYARAVNFVWNYCVETQKEVQKRWRQGQPQAWLSRFDFQNLINGTSLDLGIQAQTGQSVCKQFVESRQTNKKCPKFRHSDGPRRSLGWIPFTSQTGCRQITSNSITYRKYTYKFFGAKKRPLPSTAKGGQFFEDSKGRWYVSFYTEVKEDNNHGNRQIGVDLGLKDLITTSDGEKYSNPKYYYKLQGKLKAAQRANNNNRLRSIHAKIKNQRNDYLHKLSNKLVKESSLIIVGNASNEKLAKTYMAKSIYDASWPQLKTMLRYKASRHGVKYLETNEAFTTQTCSQCGQRPDGRPKGIAGLGIREWVCSNCGFHHDRDVNAAKNILIFGLGAQPPVEGSRNSYSVGDAQPSVIRFAPQRKRAGNIQPLIKSIH